MASRKKRTRSAVSTFIRNTRAELGNLNEHYGVDQPVLYPLQKTVFKYPTLSPEQSELVGISRSFLSKALNSPYYQLFRKSINPHILLETRRSYANQFMKSLVQQRPGAFPKELHTKKAKIEEEDKEETNMPVLAENEEENQEEEEENNEEEQNIEEDSDQIENEEIGTKGLYEDGNESELDGSEISI